MPEDASKSDVPEADKPFYLAAATLGIMSFGFLYALLVLRDIEAAKLVITAMSGMAGMGLAFYFRQKQE